MWDFVRATLWTIVRRQEGLSLTKPNTADSKEQVLIFHVFGGRCKQFEFKSKKAVKEAHEGTDFSEEVIIELAISFLQKIKKKTLQNVAF